MSIKNKKGLGKIPTIILTIFVLLSFLVLSKLLTKPSPIPKPVVSQKTTEKKIEIAGIKVNDFIGDVSKDNDYITIASTREYHIFYIPNQELFYISIAGNPFDDYQSITENVFLEKLGISKEEACKLKVDVTTLPFANPDKAGNIYHLSFCEN